MKIQRQDKVTTLVSPQTLQSIRAMPDELLFEREVNLKFAIQQQASKIEQLASDVAGAGLEHMDIQTRKATRELSEQDADGLIADNRRRHAVLQSQLIAEQEATRGLEASLAEMSREVQTRKAAILAKEKAKLADYAKVIYESMQQQIGSQMREMVILASWRSGLPLLGEAAVSPQTILEAAMRISAAGDNSLWTLKTIVDEEKQLRAKILGGGQ